MIRKCQRRARTADFITYTGFNDDEITLFTDLVGVKHNECLMLRTKDGQLIGTLHVGHVALVGMDHQLRFLTAKEFESKYETLTT